MPVHGRTCRTSEVGEDGVSDDIALDYVPAYGVAEPIAKSLRRLTARNGGPLTYRGTNCYLLGEREITVIDPGPDDEEHIADLLAAAGAPVRRIVVTHGHADHAGAAHRLSALTGAEVIGAAPDASRSFYRPDRVLADGEGVETEAQGAFLRAQGCDEAQGYYFGRPLEVDDFVAFLRSREGAP